MPPRGLAAIALALLAGCISRPAEPPKTATATGRAMATRITGVPGISNFAEIRPGLYRGAFPNPRGLDYLRSLGVRTVINLRSHHPSREEVEARGMAYEGLAVKADIFGSEPPTEEQVRRFFELVLDPARQPVFFHCAHGKDRTGTMAALYRIEVDGWTAEEAVEEMQAFGFHDNYRDLMDFVRAYRPRGFKPPR